MSLPPILTPIARGIDDSLWASVFGSAIKETKGIFLEPVAQMLTQAPILKGVSEALEAAGQKPISSALGWTLFLTPAVAYLGTCALPEGMLSSFLENVQGQIGNLYFVAFVVSKIAILYFTPGPGAIASLVFLAARQLDASGWITNKTVSKIYSNTLGITLILTQALLVESITSYLFLGFLVIGQLTPSSAENPDKIAIVEPDPVGRLTLDKKPTFFLEANVRPKDFTINFGHVEESPLPPLPTIEIDVLIKMWDKIDWSKYPQCPDASNGKLELQATVEWAKTASIYQFPHMDLRLIAECLSKRNEEIRATTLWKLATDFQANYSSVFVNLVEPSGSISFRKKVVRELQMLRGDMSLNITRRDYGKYLPHFLSHQMPNLLAHLFRAQPSNHPLILAAYPTLVSVFSIEKVQTSLNGDYNIPLMVAAISQRARVDSSFKNEMIQWWKTRINQFSEEEKGLFSQFIQTNGENIFISQDMILAMLYDFNIIQDKDPPAANSGALGLPLQNKTNG